MILWRLRGYRDPEGEWEGGVAECALERAEDGYRLPEHIWQRAKRRAHAEDKSVRSILIRALDRYGDGTLNL